MSKTASGLSLSALKERRPSDDAPEVEWEERGRRIWQAVNRSAWEMGDWWAFGEAQGYGERKAIAERIGFKFQSCVNAGVVARAFTSNRRRLLLSFAHHAEVAALDAEEQDVWLAQAEANAWSRGDLRTALRVAIPQADTPALPSGTYTTIVADPPWEYDEGWPTYADEAGVGGGGRIALPYQSMSLEQIAALGVTSLAPSDGHLFLWTTNRYLRQAYGLVEGWGFEPSQLLVWCKPPRGIGPGGVFSNTAEFVLYARRGTPKYLERVDSTWWEWPRGRHSAKPSNFLDMIENTVPGPYLEMFSREPRPGWTAWGLEA